MLLTTYALLTLSAEQKKERSFIKSMQYYLRSHADSPQQIDPSLMSSQLNELSQFVESRHQRKVEECLIPAVREATREADPLLADLELLRRIGDTALHVVRRCLRLAFLYGVTEIKLLFQSMERYCDNLLERLAKEEQELLPLAQRVVSNEQWFAIGTMFLSHDAGNTARKYASL